MQLKNFDDCDKWIFRALLYYNKNCPSSDILAPMYFKNLCRYFTKLTYARKGNYEFNKNS